MCRRVWSFVKTMLGPGAFTEIRVWAVERTEAFPEGVKYSFAYLERQGKKHVRRYAIDNAHGRGPHEHRGDVVQDVLERDWRVLLRRFYEEVHNLRGDP